LALDPSPTVFTCGYSGHTPSSLATVLKAAGVRRVIDVRSFPHSRKPGFSKGPLSEFLEREGFAYAHLPALGAPRELLQGKKGGLTFAQIAPAYRKHLTGQAKALDEAIRLARESPSTLLCLEKDPKECHRGILAQRMGRAGFRVIHL